MGGGGKGGTTTQSVSIPPEVLARYNAVNARAEETAQQPFQRYGGEFVAPLNATQTSAIQNTNAAAGQAQPYYNAATQGLQAAQQGGANYIGAATGAALAGAAPVSPQGLQVGRYMNPFTQSVVGATQAAMGQQQGQQLAQQQAEAIRAGAYGGDRAGLQRQALRGQQSLAQAQAIAPLYQQGYQQALQTAQQQQGVGLGAEQANRQAVQQLSQQLGALGQQGYAMGSGASQQLAGLGTGAQQAALQGAQAQMAAGQVQQQTQQAQDTAQYQQFLQERGYPFQVAQFLANIAMGTGALSGSTTTTQQPGGFFSDKRLKKDVKEIGETHDGQPIYSYKYKGNDRTQIGLMAQDVEKRHPEAVGLMGGYKTVDYKKATEDAERTHKDMGGGLMPDGFDYNSMGGAVTSDMAGEGFERGGYVGGGLVGNDDWSQIVAANKQALGVYGGQQPMGGGAPGAMGGLNIPTSMATPKLITAGAAPRQQPSGMSTAMQTGKDIAGIYKGGKEALVGSAADKSAGLIGGGGSTSGKSVFGELKDWWDKPSAAHGGLIVPRHAYSDGGETDNEVAPYDAAETMSGEDPMKDVLASGSKKYEMLKPGQTPGGGGGGSALGSIASGIGAVKGLASAGSWLGSTALPFLAGLSDARAKDNIRPVGKTFDGQNIYSYNIGEGPTQMGLMAQEVLDRKPEAVGRRGEYLTVDYDRATEDAAPYAAGGLVPRRGYQTAGLVSGQATEVPAEQPADDRIDRTLSALERIESGGRSDIVGPASRKGDRPYGLYQVMGANIPSWTEEALGRRMTPEEFRLDAKAQKDTARHRVGLYMNQYDDPRQAASMWFTGKPIEKAGNVADVLGTTNPKYLSMFDRYYGGQDLAPSAKQPGLKPPADVGAAPSGAGEKKGLGDIITSEGFVVPALGFLGSMLASNKPNLGQALGEGILGGVGAYQGQQKQLADIAKTKAETGQMLPVATARNIEAANKLATGLMQYNASLPPGSPKLTLQQYAKIVGYEGPLPSAAEQVTGTETKEPKPAGASPGEVKVAEPTSRNWSFSPDEKETLVITYPDGTVIPASKDPLYLSKYADRYTTMGEGWAKEQAEAARKSADEIVRSGKTVDVKGNVVSLPGAIESGQKQKIGEGLAKEALEFNDAAQKYRPEAQNILSVLDDLGSNYSIYRAGSDSAARANFDRLMKVIDPDNKHPNLHPDQSWSAAKYDKAVKDAFQLSIAQLSALSPRAPKAELDTLARTIPLPNLDAGAIQDLIGDAKARVLWNMKMHDAFDVNKDLNLNEFKKKFEKDTPFDKFKAEVKKTIPAAAGTQQQREQAAIPQSDLVAGKVYKDASGVQKKWTGSGWENP
jgi:hypothetical protein